MWKWVDDNDDDNPERKEMEEKCIRHTKKEAFLLHAPSLLCRCTHIGRHLFPRGLRFVDVTKLKLWHWPSATQPRTKAPTTTIDRVKFIIHQYTYTRTLTHQQSSGLNSQLPTGKAVACVMKKPRWRRQQNGRVEKKNSWFYFPLDSSSCFR